MELEFTIEGSAIISTLGVLWGIYIAIRAARRAHPLAKKLSDPSQMSPREYEIFNIVRASRSWRKT